MYNFHYSSLSKELINGHLANALKQAGEAVDKRVYLTNQGLSVLTDQEARITANAHLICIGSLHRVFAENMLKLQPDVQHNYNKMLHVYAKTMGLSLKLDEAKLKYAAEIEGCGYKKANLDQVSSLCHEEFGAYQIKVPEFEGIPSEAVQTCLKRSGLDLAAKWKVILEKHFPTIKEQEQLFITKKFPESLHVLKML